MTNAEKFQEIFKKFATEVWAFPEKDFLTWLNAEYKESTTVSLNVYKQVAKERDIAIQQLHELGYDFGQKIEPTTKNNCVEPRWIPVSERLPEIHNYCDRYLVTLERGWVRTASFTECDGNHWWSYDDVVAWMSLPQPYREVEEYKEKKYVNR